MQHATHATPEESRTVELRANRPQGSVDDFLAVSELILERIALVSRVKGLLPYESPVVPAGRDVRAAPDASYFQREPTVRAQENLDTFYRYVSEMGRDFDRSLRFLEPALRESYLQGKLHDPRRATNPAMRTRSPIAAAVVALGPEQRRYLA